MRSLLPSRPSRAALATGVAATLLASGIITLAPAAVSPASAAGPTVSCATDPSILNTGYDGAAGRFLTGTDSNWEVADGGSDPDPDGVQWMDATIVSNPSSRWTASPYGNASWISYSTTGLHDQNRYFFFRYQFVLDSSVKASAFSVSLDFFADNSVQDIWVNGVSQAPTLPEIPQTTSAPHDYLGYYIENAASTTLDRDWRSGQNEVIVRVDTSAPNVGFLAQTTSTGYCADYGDAPKSYGTAKDDGGASHVVTGTTRSAAALTLGSSVDVEGGPSSFDGRGDDTEGVDDEDGVLAFPELTTLTTEYSVPVSVGNSTGAEATVAGWIDFDRDGVFGRSERSFTVVPAGGTLANLAFAGLRPIEGESFARFRVFPGVVADPSPVGEVSGGEVEDYSVRIDSAGLDITKVADKSTVGEGEDLTYTITVRNPGDVPAREIRVQDDLADVLTDAVYVAGHADRGAYDYSNGVATWSGDLGAHEAATITITVQIHATLAGDRVLSNTVVDVSRPGTPTGNCPFGASDADCVWPVVAGPAFDFGDAPASYGTVLSSSGAIHALRGYDASSNTSALMIGGLVDSEPDARSSDEATGAPDEDGVQLEPLSSDDTEYRATVTVDNTLSQPATLAGWVDFDGDGLFDADERAVTTVAPGAPDAELVWSNVQPVAGQSETRFRIFPGSVSNPQPTGLVAGGEVEDYRLVVAEAPSRLSTGATLAMTGATTGAAPLLALALLLTGFGAFGASQSRSRRRPRH